MTIVARGFAPPTAELCLDSGLRAAALSSLRTFLTLLVVAHHAALAYHPYAPPPPPRSPRPPILARLPHRRCAAMAARRSLRRLQRRVLHVADVLRAGALAWPSLARRGAAAFARERALRLGIPFVVSAALFAPLAYYATYVATGADPSPIAFARTWLGLGIYPAGPAWFIWVLLAFGLVAAALSVAAPDGARRWEPSPVACRRGRLSMPSSSSRRRRSPTCRWRRLHGRALVDGRTVHVADQPTPPLRGLLLRRHRRRRLRAGRGLLATMDGSRDAGRSGCSRPSLRSPSASSCSW